MKKKPKQDKIRPEKSHSPVMDDDGIKIIEIKSKEIDLLLLEAVKSRELEKVKLCIESGADVNCQSTDGITPLIRACDVYGDKCNIEMLLLLLKQGANPNLIKPGNDGPLHYAAMLGHLDAVKILILHRAKVNARGAYKRTALIYAAFCAKMPEMVQFLIDSGADIRAKNQTGENALFELITNENSNSVIAEILIDNGLNINIQSKLYASALHWAAFCGRKNIVEVLLKNGAKVNAKDKNGETPIIKAMSQNHVEVVKLLFDNGAEPDSKGRFGWSLMEFAAEAGDKEFLLKIIAKAGKEILKGKSSLCEAAKKDNLEMVKLLLEAGTNIDEPDSWTMETPLMKASYHGKLTIVKYLLEHHADIKSTDSRGNTALLHAAWSGHLEVVKELLKNGANINEKNNLNWNALMQACVEGKYEVAKYLLEQGSPIDEIDKEKGATAMSLAKYTHNSQLIKLLELYNAMERPVKIRKQGEPYFSIFECEICKYLPDKKDLGRTEQMEKFEGLNTIYSSSSQTDRYAYSTSLVLKCINCGTYYYQYHYIDTEDAFVAGPSITHEIQRINLDRLKDALKYCNKSEELEEFKKRYDSIIENFTSILKNKPESIIPNYYSFVIESVTDYFVQKNDWNGLTRNLLEHPKPGIVLSTVKDLIMMFGEPAMSGPFPPFTYYKTITKDLLAILRPMFSNHFNEIMHCVEKYGTSDDNRIKTLYKSVMDSAKYYKLVKE